MLVYFLENIFFSTNIFSEKNLLNWDAQHYDTIRREGYHTGMVAFFPLFPFIWKMVHISSTGMSILNGLIYISSFAWLAAVYKIERLQLILLASIPSLVFMFLPFSEAVFFSASAMVITGFQKRKMSLIVAGLFLAGLTRPVSAVFIPALIAVYYLSGDRTKKSLLQYLLMIGACLVSMLFVFMLQYFQTGDWLAFIRVQKDWGNYLRIPELPLNSWAGGFIVRLDALAFFLGIAAAVFIGKSVIDKINRKDIIQADQPVLFSLCYLAVLSLTILATRGGVLNSLNRYLFCSAFFIIAVHWFLQKKYFSGSRLIWLIILSSAFWLLFASYVHIQNVLKFEFLSLYLILLFIVTSENRTMKNIGYYSLITLNLVFFMIFFHRFLNGEWVG